MADRLGPELADLLDRVLVDGPAVGIVVAGGLDRPGALPLAVSGSVGERLVLRLADPGDATAVGLRPAAVAGLACGRGVLVGTGLTVQVATPRHLEAAVASVGSRWSGRLDGGRRAPAVARLPELVDVADLPPAERWEDLGAGASDGVWSIPVGLGGTDHAPVVVSLHPGEHLLIAGPGRSGRSSALELIASQVRGRDDAARVLALAPRRSALAGSPVVDVMCQDVGELVEAIAGAGGDPPDPGVVRATFVLIDDAEQVDDPDLLLARLLERPSDAIHVVAAGRLDALRSAYGHWTQVLRRARRGLILRPDLDLDGDVLGAVLPRWEAVPPAAGRGYLVADGRCHLVQLARSDLLAVAGAR